MPRKSNPTLIHPAAELQQDTGIVLVTGFEPFGGEEINSSELVARALHGQVIGGMTVVAVVLPCVFATAPVALQQALQRWQPRLVLALGQAAGRNEMSLERVAINLIDAPMADNAGQQPTDAPVVVGGPPAHFTTLPVKAMVGAMRIAGLPADLSNTAGTFVCNQVFYCLQQQLAGVQPPVPSGFMHLPLLPQLCLAAAHSKARQPRGLPLRKMLLGLRIALMEAVATVCGPE